MKYLFAILALSFLASCSGLGTSSPAADLAGLADQIEVVRQAVLTASVSATHETRADVERLSLATLEVERALLAAADGGPFSGPAEAAQAALAVADEVLARMSASGQDVGDVPFYVALARAALLELSGGHAGAARRAIEASAGPPAQR